MDYKEKYDKALEKAKEYYKDCKQRGNLWFVEDMEDMFPELAESGDERVKKAIITLLNTTVKGKKIYSITDTTRSEMLAWLEKQGEQKPTEWSEEDEKALGDALWCCKQAASIAKDENDMGNVWYAETWLKSLKDRYTWKPSDEQMNGLKEAIEFLGCTKTRREQLQSLYEQLKKLRKE